MIMNMQGGGAESLKGFIGDIYVVYSKPDDPLPSETVYGYGPSTTSPSTRYEHTESNGLCYSRYTGVITNISKASSKINTLYISGILPDGHYDMTLIGMTNAQSGRVDAQFDMVNGERVNFEYDARLGYSSSSYSTMHMMIIELTYTPA